jgi:hypothetical protein
MSDEIDAVAEIELDNGGLILHRSDRMPAASSALENCRIITMAWGDRYIDDLLTLTIPAILAPGNLPAFVTQFQTELVIVTETRLFERVRRAPAIRKVLELCNVRLLPVDDLLSSSYGITLTYALVRGFADLGPKIVDTHLVFLNADFILADGSYRKLAEMIKRGERLVVAPSYCMNLENTIERLRAAQSKDTGAIAIPPREMAALIIANRHNTVRAKTVNQQLFRIHRYDQFYWYVDDQTLLGRQMPIAVVYMRPERALTEMPTFWDYGAISEYCPTTKPCVLGDSDDFLMAELRTSNTFGELLHLGWPTTSEIAADLSSFTTQDHRDYGRHTLILHSGDVPSNVDEEAKKLGKFVDEIYRKLSPPIDYRNHQFWAQAFPRFAAGQAMRARELQKKQRLKSQNRKQPDFSSRQREIHDLRRRACALEIEYQKLEEGVNPHVVRLSQLEVEHKKLAELVRRAALYRDEHRHAIQTQIDDIDRKLEFTKGEGTLEPASIEAAPEESDLPQEDFSQSTIAPLNRIYESFFGRIPHITKSHPYHSTLRRILPLLMRATQEKKGSHLFISSGGSVGTALRRALAGNTITITPSMVLSGLYENLRRQQIDICFCDLSFDDLFSFKEIFERTRPYMNANGKFICFYNNVTNVSLDRWAVPFTKTLFPLAGTSRVSFTGSRIAAFNMRLFSRMYRRLSFNHFGLFRIACTLICCALLARISEFFEQNKNPWTLPKHCTSMTLEIDL